MSKGLEELELIKELNVCKSTSNIEKELKALEIIKSNNYIWGRKEALVIEVFNLSQEEYDLLMEELK